MMKGKWNTSTYDRITWKWSFSLRFVRAFPVLLQPTHSKNVDVHRVHLLRVWLSEQPLIQMYRFIHSRKQRVGTFVHYALFSTSTWSLTKLTQVKEPVDILVFVTVYWIHSSITKTHYLFAQQTMTTRINSDRAIFLGGNMSWSYNCVTPKSIFQLNWENFKTTQTLDQILMETWKIGDLLVCAYLSRILAHFVIIVVGLKISSSSESE